MTRSYLAALGLLTLGLAAFAHPAQARVFVGIGVPLPDYGPPGTACYCLGNGGQRVRGNAN